MSSLFEQEVLPVLKKKSPWPESASELYRPRDRSLSAKLVPTFADRVPRGQRDGSLRPYSRRIKLVRPIEKIV
jgi:hypothetical protein